MGQELIRVIEQVSREKGIDKEVLISAVEAAVLSASKKRYKFVENIKAHFNRETGEIELFRLKKVVATVQNPHTEISLDEAHQIDPALKEEDQVQIKLETFAFGRIAAQTAKQVIVQRVREAERDAIYQEFKSRQGELINGIVQRFEHRHIIVDLGKTEAILPYSEQIPKEVYRRGDRLRALLLEVTKSTRGPQLILSRAHPDFVRRLFELEVPEISEGILEIKGTVREAGKRTKIAVLSHDDKVDAVGTCVGMKGSRVQAIVRELEGEKIDIIRYSYDPKIFVTNALSPAQVKHIRQVDEQTMEVIVADDQLSLAIGKKGQNARLASKLTGWNIDIKSESRLQKEQKQATLQKQAQDLMTLEGVGEKTALDLVEAGLSTIPLVAQAEIDTLTKISGIGPKKAKSIIQAAQAKLAEEKNNS